MFDVINIEEYHQDHTVIEKNCCWRRRWVG
jgi:hypothetical protein